MQRIPPFKVNLCPTFFVVLSPQDRPGPFLSARGYLWGLRTTKKVGHKFTLKGGILCI